VRRRIAVVYNEPHPSRYDSNHEQKAVLGVVEAASAVHRALIELGDSSVLLPLSPPFEGARRKLAALEVDVVFNLFEGFCGEPETEALVPEALEKIGLPFTGCRADVLRLALDKARIKVVLRSAGVATPDFQLLTAETLHTFRLGYPCIVKPRTEDASHGINAESVVKDFQSLEKQVTMVDQMYHGGALVEAFIGGREFNATIIGNDRPVLLPVSEIVYELPPGMPRLLTFAAKWETDSAYFKGTRAVCPAEVSDGERDDIAGAALATFRLVGCRGYARVDMRLDEAGKLNVIELNPNPDISPGSGAARQAAAAGMSYAGFVDRIVEMALEKNKYDHQDTPDVRRGQAGVDADTEAYAGI
jgi:D-alanine-D-alanine ligase